MEQPSRPQHQPAGIPPSMRRPAPARPTTTQMTPPPPPPKPEPHKHKKSFTFAMLGIGIVSILIVLAAAYMGLQKVIINMSVKSGKNNYQAVFLNNNMVYFGKISNVTGEYVTLTNIYYLQVAGQQSDQKASTPAQQQQLSLTKLGGELHGPEDTMYISRKEIIFWENLREDSKVTQAIQNYQNKK